MGKLSEAKRWAAKQDRDPTQWPVAPGVRVYMIDCDRCGSRMPPHVLLFHMRRHERLGELTE